jgi:hypothetical protein
MCTPILTLLYWLVFNYLPNSLTTELPVAVNNAFSLSTRSLAFLVSLIPMSVAIYGLITLKELFKLYEDTIYFSVKNVKCFAHLGYTLIAWVFTNMIFVTLISLVISFNNPPGERMVVVGFEISDMATLIIGTLIVLVSWVMNEASKLEDEQTYTV